MQSSTIVVTLIIMSRSVSTVGSAAGWGISVIASLAGASLFLFQHACAPADRAPKMIPEVGPGAAAVGADVMVHRPARKAVGRWAQPILNEHRITTYAEVPPGPRTPRAHPR